MKKIMQQPELGQKIVELRKGKGLTQEELVDMCNISVRTLQRIESGEVTPRSYTVKTILDALDYDISKISENGGDVFDRFGKWLKNLMLIDVDINKSSDFVIRHLNIAWIMGTLYFVLGFLDGAAEYFRYEDDRLIFGTVFYIIIKVLVLISYIYFMRGFILIGGLFRNYLLKIISVIIIFCTGILILHDIASIFYDAIERKFIIGAASLTFGGLGIIYGISLNRLRNSIGVVALYAGVIEVIAACFFLTVILGFIGLIIIIPAELLEIIIIYKAVEIIKKKLKESDPEERLATG
jgi:transcriptional regulator with XRE-family HTH domain